MYTESVAEPAAKASPESFSLQDLYELQRRQGKLKPPVITYEQRRVLKDKLRRQDGFDYSVVRAVCHMFQDFGSVSTCFLFAPLSGISWLTYRLFGSSRVDNIASGRERMARMRPSANKDLRDLLERASRLR